MVETICRGETATLVANGGTTYVWNNGVTTQQLSVSPNNTTTYTVTVSSVAGCTATASGIARVNALPNIMPVQDQAICNGASATLSTMAFGGGTVTYTWSTDEYTQTITVSPSTTTTYTVSVVNTSNCIATDEAVVTIDNSQVTVSPTDTALS